MPWPSLPVMFSASLGSKKFLALCNVQTAKPFYLENVPISHTLALYIARAACAHAAHPGTQLNQFNCTQLLTWSQNACHALCQFLIIRTLSTQRLFCSYTYSVDPHCCSQCCLNLSVVAGATFPAQLCMEPGARHYRKLLLLIAQSQ